MKYAGKNSDRREFLRRVAGAAGGAAALGIPALPTAAESPDLVVTHGDDPRVLVRKAIEAYGGMKRFVSKDDVVVVKPNICWIRKPETAANTNPDVVAGLVEMAFEAGAREVKIFDITDRDPQQCYESSGIPAAVKDLGAKLYYQDELTGTAVKIEKGRFLKESIITDFSLQCDCFINVPVAKHHNSSLLSMAMKNLMGIVKENQWKVWHPNLHQAIADFSTQFRPALHVLDAYRVIVRNGPPGGSLRDVEHPHQCIVGVNPASVDAYGATLFGRKPEEVGHIRIAAEMGIGPINLEKLNIRRIEA